MAKEKYSFEFDILDSIDDLPKDLATLLQKARSITATAYAPYSHFHVGAAAVIENGEIITGTNQENASYPVTICAERSLLATAATLFPSKAIKTMAISYDNKNGHSNSPISPCGMCRQSLLEYELRTQHPIQLVLSGLEGKVFVIKKATDLLPLQFEGEDLRK